MAHANAFDADRNTGQLPANLLRLCQQEWDEARLGQRRTVTVFGKRQRALGPCAGAEVGQLML